LWGAEFENPPGRKKKLVDLTEAGRNEREEKMAEGGGGGGLVDEGEESKS